MASFSHAGEATFISKAFMLASSLADRLAASPLLWKPSSSSSIKLKWRKWSDVGAYLFETDYDSRIRYFRSKIKNCFRHISSPHKAFAGEPPCKCPVEISELAQEWFYKQALFYFIIGWRENGVMLADINGGVGGKYFCLYLRPIFSNT